MRTRINTMIKSDKGLKKKNKHTKTLHDPQKKPCYNPPPVIVLISEPGREITTGAHPACITMWGNTVHTQVKRIWLFTEGTFGMSHSFEVSQSLQYIRSHRCLHEPSLPLQPPLNPHIHKPIHGLYSPDYCEQVKH